MSKLIPVFCLATLLAAAQPPKRCRVCVQYETVAVGRQTHWRLYQGNAAVLAKTLPARDTCLVFTLAHGAGYQLTLETDLAQTQTLSWRTDTLPDNHTFRLTVHEKTVRLNEVIVRPRDRFSRSGDTLFIDTDGVPVPPHSDATELFDRIPGLSLSGTGIATIMGSSVQQITVDGQPVFGGNARATLNALRAEMIERMEVLERTDASGRRTTTVNLRLKANRKNGLYGDVAATLGTYRRYGTAARANRLKAGRFFNAFAAHNNTNERAASQADFDRITLNSLKTGVEGVSSVVDANENRTFQAPGGSRTRAIDVADWKGDLPGVSQTTSGGLSGSRTAKKSELSGFFWPNTPAPTSLPKPAGYVFCRLSGKPK